MATDLRAWARLALLGTACLACADDAGADSLEDPFDRWCGEALCDWTTDAGTIASTGSWHRSDLAVSFQTTGTQISRALADASSPCFLVDSIVDLAAEARLVLELDFNDDTVADFEQQFVAVHWKSAKFVIKAPAAYRGVRIIVRKEGQGRAVLALLRVVALAECAGPPALLSTGSSCSRDDVCKTGHCGAGQCTALTPGEGSQ